MNVALPTGKSHSSVPTPVDRTDVRTRNNEFAHARLVAVLACPHQRGGARMTRLIGVGVRLEKRCDTFVFTILAREH